MTVQVNTREFERTHWRQPRGRGVWFFFGPAGQTFRTNGTFTEARKAAVNWAKENGFNEVTVGT